MKYYISIAVALLLFCFGFFVGYRYNESEIINPDTSTQYVPADPSPCLYNPIVIELLSNPYKLKITATDGCKKSTSEYTLDRKRHFVYAGIGYGIHGQSFTGGYMYELMPDIFTGGQCVIGQNHVAIYGTIGYRF